MSQLDDASTHEGPAALPRMTRRQTVILSLLVGAQFLLAADFSILTVALPIIGDGLGFTRENLQWIVTGFVLPAAGLTLLFGRVADLFGRRRMFVAGLTILAAASLVGGFANSPTVLVLARAGQGLATAMTVPAALSLLITSFAEGPLRDRALGVNGALMTGGFTFGALFGGVLTDLIGWRVAFFINVPVAALILVGAMTMITKDDQRERTSLDIPGALTVTGGLLAFVYGVTRVGSHGWGSAIALASFAAAAALLTAFWLIEGRTKNPLAPMHVLKRRAVGWGNFGGFVVISMASAVSFLMTLYLQEVLHYSPLTTGLAFALAGLAAVLGGTLAPRYIGRIGSQASLSLALVIQGLGFSGLLFIGDSSAGLYIMIAAVAVGFFGHAYGIVSWMVTATSGLPNEEQGLATGLVTMTQQVALTLGIPIFSAIAIARTGALAPTMSSIQASLGGTRLAVLIDVAVNLLGAALVLTFLVRASRKRDAARAAGVARQRAELAHRHALDGDVMTTMRPTTAYAAVRPGEVYENPTTGERVVIRKGIDEPPHDLLRCDLYLAPGGHAAGEHVHPKMLKSFTLIRGRVGFRISGAEQIVEGAGTHIDIAPGTKHWWWNAGDEEALIVIDVTPAGRFEQLIFRQLFGLAQDGKVNAMGKPNLLQSALLAREYGEVLRFTDRPAFVQRVLYAVLAPIARILGYHAVDPEYQQRRSPSTVALEELPRYLDPAAPAGRPAMAERASTAR